MRLDLRALGEFGLIDAIRRRAGEPGAPWVRGIGDDAAVLRPRRGHELVLTTDTLIENVHFRWSTGDAISLGRKTLAVSLSDLAAMGARPLGFLLSLGLPDSARPSCIEGFLKGLLGAARASGCPLVGGDTVAASEWILSATAVGDVPRGRALRRDRARAGDRLLVTGELGGAALGLLLLEKGMVGLPGASGFIRRQLRPKPPLEAGPLLARGRLATAAIDLSDGLAADLGHLLDASGVGADVDLDRIPLARGLRKRCGELGLAAEELALHGGEDYELLFSVPATAAAAKMYARRLSCRVTEIGVLRRGGGLRFLRRGKATRVSAKGFEHFKSPTERSDK